MKNETRYNDKLKDIVIQEAEYFVDNNSTIRMTAIKFDRSKSAVFTDLTVRLKEVDKALYDKVSIVISVNKEMRYKRRKRKN
jgi:putative DeoR family transcriptional regulator (stage III sporulation protein D)